MKIHVKGTLHFPFSINGIKATCTLYEINAQQTLFLFQQILNETVTLQRSGSGHVMIRPTIPIIAPTLEYLGNPQVSMVNVELSISNNNNGQCRVKHRDCEKQIEVFPCGERERYNDPNNWRKVYSITVQNLDDAKYNLPGTHLVQRLNIGIVNGGGGSIYSNVPLHDVRVSLVMSDATCSLFSFKSFFK